MARVPDRPSSPVTTADMHGEQCSRGEAVSELTAKAVSREARASLHTGRNQCHRAVALRRSSSALLLCAHSSNASSINVHGAVNANSCCRTTRLIGKQLFQLSMGFSLSTRSRILGWCCPQRAPSRPTNSFPCFVIHCNGWSRIGYVETITPVRRALGR